MTPIESYQGREGFGLREEEGNRENFIPLFGSAFVEKAKKIFMIKNIFNFEILKR